MLEKHHINDNSYQTVKRAARFGFLSTATAELNVKALQEAVNGGGIIIIDIPGVYDLNDTVLLDSNTRIVCAPGVIFRKTARYCNVLLNRGALTKEYNENIVIEGLEISVNDCEADPSLVYGLRGQLGFFYVKNLTIKNFTCLDGGEWQFLVYIVNWQQLHIDNVRLAGAKDGIKLGRGHDAVIKNLDLNTFDDGMSLCGTDFPAVQVEVGDVYNVHYSNVTDHQYKDIYGRTCLINTGSWADYKSGNEYRSGDFCLHEGKLYQCVNEHGFVHNASIAPNHCFGIETGCDTIAWRYIQNCDSYHADVYNITFDNCIFEKNGNVLAVWVEGSDFQRNFYPGTENMSIVRGIQVTNCKLVSSGRQVLVCVLAPIEDLTISNCIMDDLEALIRMDSSSFYQDLNLSITGCHFRAISSPLIVLHDGRKVKDWALPFAWHGDSGYIEPSGKDNSPRCGKQSKLTCYMAGNSYSCSNFTANISCGAKLRIVNQELPFEDIEELTPIAGDICRHTTGLFIYTATGWTNLSA